LKGWWEKPSAAVFFLFAPTFFFFSLISPSFLFFSFLLVEISFFFVECGGQPIKIDALAEEPFVNLLALFLGSPDGETFMVVSEIGKFRVPFFSPSFESSPQYPVYFSI